MSSDESAFRTYYTMTDLSLQERAESPMDLETTAEELLKALPPPSIQPMPAGHESDRSKYNAQPPLTTADAWQKCADAVRKYDADSCKAYREEIDTLLVFAGLFSAVVTAFTIESYQWLQMDPNDAIIALLSRIAHPWNETTTQSPEGLPDAVSTRINVYWFLSLALSLSAALIAILCKQWVREFERHADGSHRQYLGIRQMKLQGFEGWGVAAVVATVPLLLQSALGLFAAGLLELLWNLHKAVAIALLLPTGASFVFYAFTTLMPGLQLVCSPFERFRRISQCPFKSPQAMLIVRILVWVSAVWPAFNSVQPSSSALYIYSKCVIFSRRIRASWRPIYPLYASEDIGALPFWRRLRRLWQCEDLMFYDPFEDARVRRWLSMPWSSLRADEPPENTPCFRRTTNVVELPFEAFRETESWLTIDIQFSTLRDRAYTHSEYQRGVDGQIHGRPACWTMPPPFCFGALSWIRQHVNQPGTSGWMWRCVWDMAAGVDDEDPWNAMEVLRMKRGISELSENILLKSNPRIMALRYGLCTDIDPAFVAKISIHHLPCITLECDFASELYRWIILMSADDEDYVSSVVSAIWALPTQKTGPRVIFDSRGNITQRDLRPLLVSVGTVRSQSHPRSVSRLDLARVIALYLREMCTHRVNVFLAHNDLRELLLAAISCFLSEHGPGNDHPERAVFAALARAVDRGFIHLRGLTPDDARFARRLLAPSYRRVYLNLLTGNGERRSRAQLEEHFDHHYASWVDDQDEEFTRSVGSANEASARASDEEIALGRQHMTEGQIEAVEPWQHADLAVHRHDCNAIGMHVRPRFLATERPRAVILSLPVETTCSAVDDSSPLATREIAAASVALDSAITPYDGSTALQSVLSPGDIGAALAGDSALINAISTTPIDDGTRLHASPDVENFSTASSAEYDVEILQAHGGDAMSPSEPQRVRHLHSLGVAAVAPCDVQSRTEIAALEPGSETISALAAQEPDDPTVAALADRDAEQGLRARGEHGNIKTRGPAAQPNQEPGDLSGPAALEPEPEPGTEVAEMDGESSTRSQPGAAAISPGT